MIRQIRKGYLVTSRFQSSLVVILYIILIHQTESVFSIGYKVIYSQNELITPNSQFKELNAPELSCSMNYCFKKKSTEYSLSQWKDSIENFRQSRILSKDVVGYGFQIGRLEQEYDLFLNSTLRQYFKYRTFIVDVRFDFIKAKDKMVRSIKQYPPEDQPLPGMPFIPDDIRRKFSPEDTRLFYNNDTEPKLQLNKMIITIYADTIYSVHEIEFLKLLVNTSLKTEPLRNDTIKILKIPFPQKLILEREEESNPKKVVCFFEIIISFILVVLSVLLFRYFFVALQHSQKLKKNENNE